MKRNLRTAHWCDDDDDDIIFDIWNFCFSWTTVFMFYILWHFYYFSFIFIETHSAQWWLFLISAHTFLFVSFWKIALPLHHFRIIYKATKPATKQANRGFHLIFDDCNGFKKRDGWTKSSSHSDKIDTLTSARARKFHKARIVINYPNGSIMPKNVVSKSKSRLSIDFQMIYLYFFARFDEPIKKWQCQTSSSIVDPSNFTKEK